MNLLKIGTLNIPSSRWEDALIVFDNVYHLSLDHNEISRGVGFIPLIQGEIRLVLLVLRKLDFLVVKIFGKQSALRILLIKSFSFLFSPWLNLLDNFLIDHVHVSYNDFDDSSFLHLFFLNQIYHMPILRAYKESRPGYDSVEHMSLQKSNIISVTTEVSKKFFLDKYPDLKNSKFIIGSDEDWRSSRAAELCKTLCASKYSSFDQVPHFVILAGFIYSDSNNIRNGSRLYYLPLVKKILEKGWHVHIHTKKIFLDSHGVNVYEQIRSAYPSLMHIENPLDFENDVAASYEKLSSYDFGILHNWMEGHSTTQFDTCNIPHRIYEYLYSGVYPVVEDFQSELIETAFPSIKAVSLDSLLKAEQPQKIYCIEANTEHSFIKYIRCLYDPQRISSDNKV